MTAESTWLDYGCGVGGLVAFLRARGVPRADGFDPSPATKGFMPPGVGMVSTNRLADLRGHFDVVTAIEVLNHVPDPVAELALLRSRAGLQPMFPGYGPGWTGIVRYRILQRLRRRRNSPLDRLVPWPLVCRLVNWRVGLAAQPMGWNSPPPGA